MLQHDWLEDGSLRLTISVDGRVFGESVEHWCRVVIPEEDLGRLRHILVTPKPTPQGQTDANKIAGFQEKVAGTRDKGTGV